MMGNTFRKIEDIENLLYQAQEMAHDVYHSTDIEGTGSLHERIDDAIAQAQILKCENDVPVQ